MAKFMKLSQDTVNVEAILYVRHVANVTNAKGEEGIAVVFSGYIGEKQYWGDDAAKILEATKEPEPAKAPARAQPAKPEAGK